MSIVTRTGDDGTTGLMYGRRVSKTHPRVEAYGAVDELNAALGLARASARHDFISRNLLRIQHELVIVMGELATAEEDLERYVKDGFKRVGPEMALGLEEVVKEIESQKVSFRGWAMPGESVCSSALDVARTVCRRAERRICALIDAGEVGNRQILIYLNRLADLLWLMARWEETRGEPQK
ncbi:MAG TPA: cob(I)yrinic acid a,c-diamide adenosyltransferase [Verrucomicrobia bacterium]|nr:cob(I)yrinic acid a,c-diamide adenosyltransferase [Verrucomicrobiota bacterium]